MTDTNSQAQSSEERLREKIIASLAANGINTEVFDSPELISVGQVIADEIMQTVKAELGAAREIFIPVTGYEGIYEVSNTGKIRSLIGNRYSGRELKPSERGKPSPAYLFVSLANKGVVKNWSVHRLVALAWLSNPENKKTVNHKDGNKSNNNLSNLEWATYKENVVHSFEVLGRVTHNKGTAILATSACVWCGKEITDKKWRNRVYCSQVCNGKHQRSKDKHHFGIEEEQA